MDYPQPEEGNCLSHTVCCDSVALMPLIRTNRALFSDGGDTAGISGHDRDDDGSPAELFGYLPPRLFWPWSLDGMTQCQAKINGPVEDTLRRVILDDGGLWDIQISVTPPATHARKGLSPTLISRRASVGGSAAPTDWRCVLGPPGGIWISFIRRTVEHRQSIVAVTVTGSLDFPTLLSRRDANSIYRPLTLCEYCDTDWSLPLLQYKSRLSS